jgi:hypothetical protein
MIAGEPQVDVDCHVRATASGVLVDDTIDRLHSFEEVGLINELNVEYWPDEIRLTEGTEETAILGHYRQFLAWGHDEGVSIEPAFTRRERSLSMSDDSEKILVLPVVCVSIRVEDELVCFAPHSTETTAYTVTDALANIESLPRPMDIKEIPPDHPVRSSLWTDSAEDQSFKREDKSHTI